MGTSKGFFFLWGCELQVHINVSEGLKHKIPDTHTRSLPPFIIRYTYSFFTGEMRILFCKDDQFHTAATLYNAPY
jgi:hypothetical protein